MPKITKKKFEAHKIDTPLTRWRNAATELSRIGRESYNSIRSYLSKYERIITEEQKTELSISISEFNFNYIRDDQNNRAFY